MAAQNDSAKDRILTAAATQLRRLGADRVTLENVAREAGCAKGLVHYHYRSKARLVSGALEKVLADRERRWSAVPRQGQPAGWVKRTWELIIEDASEGFPLALNTSISQGDELTVQTAKNGLRTFQDTFGAGLTWFLTSQGLQPTIPIEELSGLASATVLGMTIELAAGKAAADVEAAYAALWLGMLSSTRAARE